MQMKLTTFLLFAACLHISAAGLSQDVTLAVKDAPLRKVLLEISRQTGVSIVANETLFVGTQPVTINVKELSLREVLDICLKNQPVGYTIENNNIIIKNTSPGRSPAPPAAAKDTVIPVSGVVTDSTGVPIPGVTVLVKDTRSGTQTDASGRFTLSLSPGRTLVFSYTGYLSQEVAVGSRTSLHINLMTDIKSLESVVVIGYGTKRKQSLTGAISVVNADVIKSRPITNAVAALQGQVPGLVVQRSSGQPGSEGFDLNVRGYSSTNGGNSPLVLIDGIAGSFDLLNPDDIESITVLKDASASIYGARAANGVMLVTTKRGKKGTPSINYSNNFAVSKLTGMMKSPTNYEMAVMDNEANIHNSSAPMYTQDMLQKILSNDSNPIPHPLYGGWMLFFTNTDWKNAVFENGFQQKHSLNVSGGGNNSSYYLSGSYSNQAGVVRYANDNNRRYNLRMNYNYDFFKWLRLESKVSFEDQRRTDIGGMGGWNITEAIFGMPNHPVYTPDGKFFAQGGWGNAVAQAKEGATATFNTRNINTNFKLIADITSDLKLNLQAGINYQTGKDEDIAKAVPLYNWDGGLAYYGIASSPELGSLTLTSREAKYRNFTGYLEYNKNFGKHELNVMAGMAHEENDDSWFSAYRDHFVTADLWSMNLGGTQNMKNDSRGTQWAISSAFSRVSYSFDNKYLLEANFRYDGSSRFQQATRWGLFPGVSAAWRLSEENFIKESGLFNDLKLRASYGQTGNQEGVGLYDYIQLLNISGPYPLGPGGQNQSAALAGMVSLNRTWETLINRNIGIDASVLASRLNFSFDYFVKTNKDLLIPVTYPSLLGATAPYSNSGELKTWGFEASLGWKDKIGKLDYSARVIISDAQNKIVNYGGADTYVPGLNMIREGYPINTYFAYVFDGLIRDQKQLDEYKKLDGVPSDIGIGDAMFKDVNGDGKISPYSDKAGSDGDVVNVGSITPRYSYGVNLNAKYRNFDVGIFLQGVGKRVMFREGEYAMPWSDWWRQPPEFYYGQTWNEDRPDAAYPRLTHGNIRTWNYQPSTLQEINAAYVRLKNLTVGYSLPAPVLQRVSIAQARIYFSGQDLAEIHHVKGGWDPESSQNGFNYPFQRLYSFGLDITF
ncbi:TonB-dependent receptor [Chitinophaga sp. MM2321]|uniref:SusC/RagA family TonB-linked outer membrane protein n=1 Tax=Chitinophaga sp. MM2321 TaxID=3137178 RepID=UPI0032D59C3E